MTPTSPSVAFELGARTADPLAMYLSDYFTVPMSLAGIPAISIPAGLAEPPGGGSELPVGLQLAAPAFAETRLLDAAHALERRDRLSTGGRRDDDRGRHAARPSIEALDALPHWVREQLGEVAVIVEDSHPDGIMGIYDPIGGLRADRHLPRRQPERR